MIIDILFLLVAGFGFYRGYNSGIIRTVFTVISIILGLIIAMRYAVPFSETLSRLFNVEHPFMFIVGFLLAFILSLLLVRMIARLLERVLQSLNINILNRLAGGFVFSFILILIYSVILWFLIEARLIKDIAIEESFTYPYLETFPDQSKLIFEKTKPIVREFWNNTGEAMNKDQ